MKILVFEYITGGGFNKQALPDSLADEGRSMLLALLDNLAQLPDLDVTVMTDRRLEHSLNTASHAVVIGPEHDVCEEFARLAGLSDSVWPIAPEFDGILQSLCQIVESLGKILLTSSAEAVAITGNKFKTYEWLNRHRIATVPTRMFDADCSFDKLKTGGEWIVKPVDGVACLDSYVLATRQDFELMAARPGSYIIQPHLQGEKTSLSCLFKQGRGWLLAVNLQRFEFIDQQYHLAEILVNYYSEQDKYQQLIADIAQALPELWGYVGIDLIETEQQTWVLEINPRLTSSFIGLQDALGVNVAATVLQLLHGDPLLIPTRNQSSAVQIK